MTKTSKVLKHRDYLTLLSKAKKKRRRQKLIDLADNSEIQAICEIVYNILGGRLPLKPEQKKKLKRHRVALRNIVDRSKSVKKKKKILQQSGGFLSAVLPLVVSALGSIVPALFGKKK